MRLIDPPSPFGTREEWESFLAEMRGLLEQEPKDAQIKRAIAEAEAELARRDQPEEKRT